MNMYANSLWKDLLPEKYEKQGSESYEEEQESPHENTSSEADIFNTPPKREFLNLSEENYYEARNISADSFDKVVDNIVYQKYAQP